MLQLNTLLSIMFMFPVAATQRTEASSQECEMRRSRTKERLQESRH